MGTMLDIVGALIVRGTIIVIMLTATVALNDALYFKAASRNIQGDLNATVEVLDSDLRKIGYNTTAQPLLACDSTRILFLADMNDDLLFDTVEYSVSDTLALASTPNPADLLLYRRASNANGGNPLIVGSGITRFRLRYYAADGTQTVDTLTRVIEVEVDAQHGYYQYNGFYPSVHWQRRIFPPNL